MARGFSLTPQLDIQQIQMEAKSRWLRPSEICEILRNYQKLNLTPDPPYKPSGGSLYLFDRKALRYFRKDGHCWRKKKDGKTVREAHEKLKSGSVDVVHCYYAHGEENENFQRRSYWMLDGQLEHIVLVHYRDVSEGSKPSIPHLSNKDPGTVDKANWTQTSSAVCSTHLVSAFASQACNASSPSTVEWNEPTPSSEFEDADSGDDFGCSASLNHPYASGLTGTASLNSSFHNFFMNPGSQQNLMLNEDQQRICAASQPSDSSGAPRFSQRSNSTWDNIPSLNQKSNGAQECSISFEQPNPGDEITRRMVDSLPDDYRVLHYGLDGGSNILTDAHAPSFRRDESTQLQVKEENSEILYRRFTDNCTEDDSVYTYKIPHEHEIYTTTHSKYNSGSQRKISSVSQPLLLETEGSCASKDALESDTHIDEPGELKKVDSFGRWMTKEIGKDCDDYLMASDSHNYWNALTSPSDVKDISSLSHHMQLNIHSPGPSLSQEQLFSILDFSPDWAYSGIETKILITGTFLGHNEPNTIKWCCMFGEQEVSAEVLNTTAIRCQAPPHSPGRVPFYITCSNRLACSEVREFEYRENLSGGKFSLALNSEPEEVHLQVRFAKMLSLRADRKKLICSVENCLKCKLKKSFSPLLSGDGQDWDRIEKDSKNFRGYDVNHRNTLLEKLFRDMLYEWLVYKVHEEGKGPNVLDEEGQGVVHLAAALGYEWAIGPIVAAGVHPSFRDAHGRTALHWAAYFGREETVVTLVKLGAASGAVEDPTSKFPEGQTAADLASSRGHKGVAGYLAEAALTSHLSSLTFRETMVDGDLATLAAEEAVEAIKEHNIFSLDGNKGEDQSLRGSLDAVRNSAQAAARIQFAYRVHSFRQRQLTTGSGENDDIDDNALVLSSLRPKVHRICHFNDSLHIAAVKIQQKFRGWRGRKDFLKIRDRIVKIQAHVRGYQVRKQYRKVVWSVSIVEKAILRWRRKRSGLRGFRSDKTGAARQEVDDIGEYEFLRLGRNQKVAAVKKALARVQSMVRYPEARDQYMRLVASSHKSKLAEEGNLSPQVQHLEEEKKADGYLFASMMD